jgi:hypothetical protein
VTEYERVCETVTECEMAYEKVYVMACAMAYETQYEKVYGLDSVCETQCVKAYVKVYGLGKVYGFLCVILCGTVYAMECEIQYERGYD